MSFYIQPFEEKAAPSNKANNHKNLLTQIKTIA